MNGKYNFPKFKRIIIRNFSLYTKDKKIQVIDEKINDGVFCLAGANGLGKTTFLNAINYALTGVVLEPNKEVYSPKEIIKSNKLYTHKYFKGRVKATDEKNAEIELHLKVNDTYFRIVRGFFEPNSLRVFEMYKIVHNQKIPQNDTIDLSPNELNEEYQKEIAKIIGLNNFDFFVFLQLYVLTFDENRRMIFWDERASTHALSIAFNTDLTSTEQIINLKRDIEKYESNARNKRWQATQIGQKIKNLQEVNKEDNENLDELQKYKEIVLGLEKLEKVFSDVKIEYDTLLKNQSYLNADIMNLRHEHGRLFSLYTKPRSALLENTYIQMSLEKNECCICHAKSEQIHEKIQHNIFQKNCPLCGTTISENNREDQKALLEEITKKDQQILEKTKQLEEVTVEINAKKFEVEKAEYEFNEIKNKKYDIEKSTPNIMEYSMNTNLHIILQEYKRQYDELDQETNLEYKKRDHAKETFKKLQVIVEKAYLEAEIDFVPIFQKFAKSFIGLDLSIKFQKGVNQIKLVLELENSSRTNSSQLSESQRFFLDIALRMAIAQYLSKKDNEATILIDTPEGSLDIAYENRVGQMFADFVAQKQHIIMTANINASQLLIALAKRCGSERMTFKRMLDWTDLSIIQKEGEGLFEEVYLRIENAMKECCNA